MMLEQGEMTVDDLLASDEEVDFGEDDEEDADADLDGGRDQHQAETARQQGEGIGRSNSRQQPRGSPDTATLAAAEEASRAKKADAISWAKWKGDTAADDTKGASNKENGRHDSRTADKRKSADKRGSDRAARRRSRSRTRSGSRQRDRLRPRSPVRELALRRRSPPSAYGSPLGHYSGYPSDYRGPPPPGYPGPPWHGSAGRHPYEPRPLPLRPLSPPRDLDYRGRPYYDDPYRERGPLPFPPDRQPSPPYGRERELSPPRSRYSPGHERVTRSGRLSPPPLFPSAQPKPDYDRYPRIDGRDRLPPPAGARTSPPASAITARERQALEREQQKEWYYVDPQGKTQGPCAIAQFRKWLHLLKSDPARQAQYVEFGEVMAWRKGMPTGTKLLTLTQ
ncbi:hypothetical protein WJX72_008589 [[Myrmecia] bisecta]|uniref:GYF domain-containing protein n=1 Tax=[Myrmecia] bisecta TaxID=41462 RepID=A0AAW1Q795_9CHLO